MVPSSHGSLASAPLPQLASECLPPEIILEIIRLGITVWDKATCTSATQVSSWWKQYVQTFRCQQQSVILLPRACFFPARNDAYHSRTICCHRRRPYRFWEMNPQIGQHVFHLKVISCSFIEIGRQDNCNAPKSLLCDIFPNAHAFILTGHFTPGFLHQINARQMTQLVIGPSTLFPSIDIFLELFCSTPLLSTLQIHLAADSTSSWLPLNRVAAPLVTHLSRLAVVIEGVESPLSQVRTAGQFFDWLLGDARDAISRLCVCFIEAPSILDRHVERLIRCLANTLVEVGISLHSSCEVETGNPMQAIGKS